MDTSVSIAGATGLVGGHCVSLFVERPEFARVELLVRRPAALLASQRRAEEKIVDFDDLRANDSILRTSHVVCALGTTIRKAGSQEAFRRVDHDYPLAIARLALERGARHFLLVSSIGANPDSRIFYSRVKGEIERDILALGFPAVTIARPSFLAGERSEFRLGETLARPLFRLAPGKYRPIHAREVAAALVRAALRDEPGVTVLDSSQMRSPE